MQSSQLKYDVAIVGGGLAGLALSIQLARKNFNVVLFEKEKYPFHKVCGEYISMESWNFLEGLGLPLSELNLPKINTLNLTSPNGKSFTTKLPLGGFGFSRYRLDHSLSIIAIKSGVHVMEETKVEDVRFANDNFFIQYFAKKENAVREVKATICCGAYGKRNNLDVKWKRDFLTKTDPRINNYIAVKYHVNTNLPGGIIGLHNFKNGYCGISEIEEKKYCLCYLTTAANLKRSNNSIPQMEKNILFQNPVLKNIFLQSDFIYSSPVTISQISFSKKSLVENNVLMLGDAAGMITPLCGNGMSMALHSSKIVATSITGFLNNYNNRTEMERSYRQQWEKEFSRRLISGRALQSFFGSVVLSNVLVAVVNLFPFLAKSIIRKTHGKTF